MRIRIPVLSIVLFTCIAVSVNAQQKITPKKHLKGGLVFSKLINTDWEASSAPGFALGISLDFPFTDFFSVQPEVFYMEKGGRLNVSSLNTEFDLEMDYIEVPVVAKYHFPLTGLIQPNIFLGSFASFLIEKNSNTEIQNNQDLTPDKLVHEAKNTDFGAVFGIGTELHFIFNNMTAEVRYSAGLTNAFNNSVPQTIRNGTLAFLVGFGF